MAETLAMWNEQRRRLLLGIENEQKLLQLIFNGITKNTMVLGAGTVKVVIVVVVGRVKAENQMAFIKTTLPFRCGFDFFVATKMKTTRMCECR